MKNLNLYEGFEKLIDTIKRKDEKIGNQNLKKKLLAIGLIPITLTSTSLVGCNNNPTEIVEEETHENDEPLKQEETHENDETVKEENEMAEEKTLVLNRDAMEEEEFLTELWKKLQLVENKWFEIDQNGNITQDSYERRHYLMNINLENYLKIAEEVRPFLDLENFHNEETGELVDYEKLHEEHGEIWAPIMYAREMSREDKMKTAIWFNFAIEFLMSGPDSFMILYNENKSFFRESIIHNVDKYLEPGIEYEENSFLQAADATVLVFNELTRENVQNTGNADYFFTMPYLTPERRSTTQEPWRQDLNSISDGQLATSVGMRLAIGKIEREILDKFDAKHERFINSFDLFRKLQEINIKRSEEELGFGKGKTL